MQDLKRLIKEQLASKNLSHLGDILDSQTDKTKTLNIIDLMIKRGFIELDQGIKVYLFNKLYWSGYFCYTVLDSQDFKKHFDYIKPDLDIIASLVTESKTLEQLDQELTSEYMQELYQFIQAPELVDLLD